MRLIFASSLAAITNCRHHNLYCHNHYYYCQLSLSLSTTSYIIGNYHLYQLLLSVTVTSITFIIIILFTVIINVALPPLLTIIACTTQLILSSQLVLSSTITNTWSIATYYSTVTITFIADMTTRIPYHHDRSILSTTPSLKLASVLRESTSTTTINTSNY